MTNNNPFKTKIIAALIFASSLSACTDSATLTSAQNKQTNDNQANQTTNKNQTAAVEDKRTALHRRLDSLAGEWAVEKSNYFVLGGTAEKPFVSTDLICRREWIKETGSST